MRRGILLGLVLSAAVLSAALAHDHTRPQLDGWYKGLQSGKGPCCDGSDAQSLADPDWDSKDGHYRVRLDGEWVVVPDEAVISEPNRDGRTLVWPLRGYLGTTVRCFMPGTMS